MPPPISSSYDPYNVLNLFQMPSENDIATRAAIYAFKSAFGGKSTSAIIKVTGILTRTINVIFARIIEKGFDPIITIFIINNTFVKDALRSGRLKKQI